VLRHHTHGIIVIAAVFVPVSSMFMLVVLEFALKFVFVVSCSYLCSSCLCCPHQPCCVVSIASCSSHHSHHLYCAVPSRCAVLVVPCLSSHLCCRARCAHCAVLVEPVIDFMSCSLSLSRRGRHAHCIVVVGFVLAALECLHCSCAESCLQCCHGVVVASSLSLLLLSLSQSCRVRKRRERASIGDVEGIGGGEHQVTCKGQADTQGTSLWGAYVSA
jgi:hypothetical protein